MSDNPRVMQRRKKSPPPEVKRPWEIGAPIHIKGMGRKLYVVSSYGPGFQELTVQEYGEEAPDYATKSRIPFSDVSITPFIDGEDRNVSNLSDSDLSTKLRDLRKDNEKRIAALEEEEVLRAKKAKLAKEQAAQAFRTNLAENKTVFLALVPNHNNDQHTDSGYWDHYEDCKRCAVLYAMEQPWDANVELILTVKIKDCEVV